MVVCFFVEPVGSGLLLSAKIWQKGVNWWSTWVWEEYDRSLLWEDPGAGAVVLLGSKGVGLSVMMWLPKFVGAKVLI